MLCDGIRGHCPFEEEDFIHISKMPSHDIAICVALAFIRDFPDDVDREAD